MYLGTSACKPRGHGVAKHGVEKISTPKIADWILVTYSFKPAPAARAPRHRQQKAERITSRR